jgi:hypothetical protein
MFNKLLSINQALLYVFINFIVIPVNQQYN